MLLVGGNQRFSGAIVKRSAFLKNEEPKWRNHSEVSSQPSDLGMWWSLTIEWSRPTINETFVKSTRVIWNYHNKNLDAINKPHAPRFRSWEWYKRPVFDVWRLQNELYFLASKRKVTMYLAMTRKWWFLRQMLAASRNSASMVERVSKRIFGDCVLA